MYVIYFNKGTIFGSGILEIWCFNSELHRTNDHLTSKCIIIFNINLNTYSKLYCKQF